MFNALLAALRSQGRGIMIFRQHLDAPGFDLEAFNAEAATAPLGDLEEFTGYVMGDQEALSLVRNLGMVPEFDEDIGTGFEFNATSPSVPSNPWP